MLQKYIAAVDQGTSSSRCLFFDQDTRVIASDQLEHRQIFPQPGWVEHNPMEIWEKTQQVIATAMQRQNITASQIASIGIANQRETTVVWNKTTGQPYCNAIVWQCARSQAICDRLALDGGSERFREKTGLPLAAYFSGTKVVWILENIPGVRRDAEKGEAIFGNMDTWLIWWLTGGPSGGRHLTDVTNASRTLMMNIRSLEWDQEILKALAIPPQMLPGIRPSSDSEIYGFTRKDGPFKGSIPICGDLGDQQSALVGQACFKAGDTKNTYGTGCFMLMNTGPKAVFSRHGLLTTLGYKINDSPPAYCLEGSVAVAGALVQWMRDNLGFFKTSAEIEALARTVDDNGGVYFVPAFSGLFAPHWRSDARGVMVGLTRFANKGHFARAALEATAFQTRDILEVMELESGIKLNSLKVDGGMVQNELLMQFQADIVDTSVVRSGVAESTALGAAFMAGLASGFWKDLAQLGRYWEVDKTWEPNLDKESRDLLIHNWKRAVQRSLNWIE